MSRHAPHGHDKIEAELREATLMIRTGLFRVFFWSALLGLFLLGLALHGALGLSAIEALFAAVAFTASISTISLIETAWGQVCASKAQLSAILSHRTAEHTREQVGLDFGVLEADIEALAAALPSSPETAELVEQIHEHLGIAK